MAPYAAQGQVPAIATALCRRGELHVAAHGVASDTIFRIASMSKPVAAAAAMILVEEGRFRLDEPVARLLPELADRRVLKSLDAELDDTQSARGPILVRDLMQFTMGFGIPMLPFGTLPIQRAADALDLGQGPPHPQLLPGPDEWMRRFATLPLMHQPGEKWMYNTGSDVLGVLIARAAGQPLDGFLRERLFGPLGMNDTGFFVPPDKIGRFTACHAVDFATGRDIGYDPVGGDKPPSRVKLEEGCNFRVDAPRRSRFRVNTFWTAEARTLYGADAARLDERVRAPRRRDERVAATLACRANEEGGGAAGGAIPHAQAKAERLWDPGAADRDLAHRLRDVPDAGAASREECRVAGAEAVFLAVVVGDDHLARQDLHGLVDAVLPAEPALGARPDDQRHRRIGGARDFAGAGLRVALDHPLARERRRIQLHRRRVGGDNAQTHYVPLRTLAAKARYQREGDLIFCEIAGFIGRKIWFCLTSRVKS